MTDEDIAAAVGRVYQHRLGEIALALGIGLVAMCVLFLLQMIFTKWIAPLTERVRFGALIGVWLVSMVAILLWWSTHP